MLVTRGMRGMFGRAEGLRPPSAGVRARSRIALVAAGAALLAGAIAGMAPRPAQAVAPGDLFTIGRLRYRGGGDWYTDTSALPNLLRGLRERFGWKTALEEDVVQPDDELLFNDPLLFMTGHGRVTFTDDEAARLRRHLESGGFLWADDCYGMDEFLRPALRKIFPEEELLEIPFDHEIYRTPYPFPHGLPKIHEHHGGPPKGYGIIHRGRLVVFYSYNTDIGDGMENEDVHHDPAEKREEALRMGINVAHYVATH
jgi:hypothetical protein